MPYTEKELYAMEFDPIKAKQYFWRCAMGMRRTAKQNRLASRATGVSHPVTNYKYAFEEGRDLITEAKHLDRVADAVLENIDALVQSCLPPLWYWYAE